MSKSGLAQTEKMRWIVFYIFIGLFVLIVLVTIAAVFYGFGNVPQEVRQSVFNIYIIEIGVAVIALFYSLFGLKKDRELKPSEVIDLAGNWKYQSEKANSSRKYLGECKITQDGRSLNISGYLKKVQISDKGITHEENINIRWDTRWAYLFEDNMLRFDFDGNLPKGATRGYCVMRADENNPAKLSGEYYILPPDLVYKGNFGNITFEKIEKA